ncbi:MAG: VWA domain-containing protein [Acidobacteriaceae bacterium]|nr:VWA domain-containing protein [Acidobacteriaceae bacterium]
MKPLRTVACLSIASTLLGAPAWAQFKPAAEHSAAQAKETAQAPVFSANVNLVRLLVSVRDSNGALITNLDRRDFRVLDSGVEQTISLFERNTSVPLSVALMIDTSASTRADLHFEEDSVLRFVPTLLEAGNPDDTFALFSFNWHVTLESDFSRNPRHAERALHALRGDGGTSLYDAIYLVSDTLSTREGRHVVVLVTDGGDTTSYKKYQDALAAAQRSDVVIYPVVVIPIASDAGRNTGGEHALATLAASTGGRIFYPEGFERLDAAFADILHELRTQYLLGYYPRDVQQQPRSFHPIKIEVPNAPVRISARSGYYQP